MLNGVDVEHAAAVYCDPDAIAHDTHSASAADYQFLQRIYRTTRSGPAVVAVNTFAWKQGVRPGMPLAEARSMAGSHDSRLSVQFYPWQASDDRIALTALAEEVRSFAPIIGIDELPLPDCLLLDVSGCGPLFGGESALAERLLGRIRALGFRPRIAISESVATAWAFAHADESVLQRGRRMRQTSASQSAEWRMPAIIIPPGQARNQLDELPVASGRFEPGDVEIFHQLGVGTLARVLNLPLDDLPTRLSSNALVRIRQLLGDRDELITAIPEADPIQARWSSEHAVQNHHAIREVLNHLSERIARQLQHRLVGATTICCEIRMDENAPVTFQADFVRPVQSDEVIRDMLILRLERVSTGGPVTAISVQATIAPLPAARQRDLFDSTEHILPQEEVATLVNRLSNRLGHQSVLHAELTSDPRPEFNTRLTPVFSNQTGVLNDRLADLVTPAGDVTSRTVYPQLDRPISLLAEPLVLHGLDDSLIGCKLHLDSGVAIIATVTGPERFQTSWWEEEPIHRDYFKVTTSEGSCYWLFQDIRTKQWFVHGVFD